MTDFQTVAARYIDTWNETDPARRRMAVASLWATDGRYVDPLADVEGHDQIDATIAAVQAQFPSFRFRLAGPVDGHGHQCRFTGAWASSGTATSRPCSASSTVSPRRP